MSQVNLKDFHAGLLYMILGVAFGWGATNYDIGSAADMGPGYFPLLCACLLFLVGVIVLARSLRVRAADIEPIGKWAFRPLFFITLANMLFGILLGGMPALGLPSMGLIVAIFVLAVVAAMAGSVFRWKEVLVLAVILTAGSWAIFIWGLNMQFQIWPEFIPR